jgi:dihydroorotate dehydrogenase (fumarate)
MTDLTTTYMGLKLRTPLVVSAAQPLSEDIANIKRMEDAGAAAVVLYSLFEEQLTLEKLELYHHLTAGTESYAESLTYFPEVPQFELGPEGYLKHIEKAKQTVKIPVIASLNGTTVGGWTKFAKQMESAGADAIELNIYWIPADMDASSADIEQRYLDIVSAVKGEVSIPVGVKIGPYFSNMANMARRLDAAGADGLVLFNRFYQPDIDLEHLDIRPNIILSTPQALRLPLRWIAILYGRVSCSLAATSGIHRADDVLKMIMAGASVTMLCSALMRYGIEHIRDVEQGMRDWMQEHEYESIEQMQGSMSQKSVENPGQFERVQYMRGITSYKPEFLKLEGGAN